MSDGEEIGWSITPNGRGYMVEARLPLSDDEAHRLMRGDCAEIEARVAVVLRGGQWVPVDAAGAAEADRAGERVSVFQFTGQLSSVAALGADR